jgi:hypothetical protein
MTVLVTPLKTVDSLIKRLPIIGHVTGQNFMAIPVRITGDPSNSKVTPMSASAVSEGVRGILERALKLPAKVTQPFLPDQEKKEE